MDRHALAYRQIIGLLLKARRLRDPNPERAGVTGYEHALQCATHAEHAYADAELVVVAFTHDLAKPLTMVHHGEVMAEMLREYVSVERYHVLRTHGEFQADRIGAAARYLGESWVVDALALHAWEARSFEPRAKTLPATYFLERLSAAMRARE